MKTYSIGRDMGCDIVINDSTDVISRRHALLNITPSGKMTIIDQSSNGTYVNGIRISQNVPVPVTRKDIISLAHVAKLDWNQIPKSNQGMKYFIIGLVAVILVLGIIFGAKELTSDKEDPVVPAPVTEVNDTPTNIQKEKARQDTIPNAEEKAKQDPDQKADQKAKQESKEAVTGGKSGKTGKSAKGEKGDKNETPKGKEKEKSNPNRVIG